MLLQPIMDHVIFCTNQPTTCGLYAGKLWHKLSASVASTLGNHNKLGLPPRSFALHLPAATIGLDANPNPNNLVASLLQAAPSSSEVHSPPFHSQREPRYLVICINSNHASRYAQRIRQKTPSSRSPPPPNSTDTTTRHHRDFPSTQTASRPWLTSC